MPQNLSNREERIVRDLIYTNFGTINSYDPSISDPSDTNFLPITDDWDSFGDTYPIIVLSNFDSNAVGGGNTTWTGQQGDGSGLNQQRQAIGRLTIQAEGKNTYNGDTPKDILKKLGDNCEDIIQNNGSAQNNSDIWNFSINGPRKPHDRQEDPVLYQYQYEVGFMWLKTPP